MGYLEDQADRYWQQQAEQNRRQIQQLAPGAYQSGDAVISRGNDALPTQVTELPPERDRRGLNITMDSQSNYRVQRGGDYFDQEAAKYRFNQALQNGEDLLPHIRALEQTGAVDLQQNPITPQEQPWPVQPQPTDQQIADSRAQMQTMRARLEGTPNASAKDLTDQQVIDIQNQLAAQDQQRRQREAVNQAYQPQAQVESPVYGAGLYRTVMRGLGQLSPDPQTFNQEADRFYVPPQAQGIGKPADEKQMDELFKRQPAMFQKQLQKLTVPLLIQQAQDRQVQRKMLPALPGDSPELQQQDQALVEQGQQMRVGAEVKNNPQLGFMANVADTWTMGLFGRLSKLAGIEDVQRVTQAYAEQHPTGAMIAQTLGYLTPTGAKLFGLKMGNVLPVSWLSAGLDKVIGGPVAQAVNGVFAKGLTGAAGVGADVLAAGAKSAAEMPFFSAVQTGIATGDVKQGLAHLNPTDQAFWQSAAMGGLFGGVTAGAEAGVRGALNLSARGANAIDASLRGRKVDAVLADVADPEKAAAARRAYDFYDRIRSGQTIGDAVRGSGVEKADLTTAREVFAGGPRSKSVQATVTDANPATVQGREPPQQPTAAGVPEVAGHSTEPAVGEPAVGNPLAGATFQTPAEVLGAEKAAAIPPLPEAGVPTAGVSAATPNVAAKADIAGTGMPIEFAAATFQTPEQAMQGMDPTELALRRHYGDQARPFDQAGMEARLANKVPAGPPEAARGTDAPEIQRIRAAILGPEPTFAAPATAKPAETPIPAEKVLAEIKRHNTGELDETATRMLVGNQPYVLRDVPIKQIGAVFGPAGLKAEKIKQYAEQPASSAPPITLGQVDGQGALRPIDGKHRLGAAMLRGDQSIKAYVPAKFAEQFPPVAAPQAGPPLPKVDLRAKAKEQQEIRAIMKANPHLGVKEARAEWNRQQAIEVAANSPSISLKTQAARFSDALDKWDESGNFPTYSREARLASAELHKSFAAFLKHAIPEARVEKVAESAGSRYYEITSDTGQVKVRVSNHAAPRTNSHEPNDWSFEVGDSVDSVTKGIESLRLKLGQKETPEVIGMNRGSEPQTTRGDLSNRENITPDSRDVKSVAQLKPAKPIGETHEPAPSEIRQKGVSSQETGVQAPEPAPQPPAAGGAPGEPGPADVSAAESTTGSGKPIEYIDVIGAYKGTNTSVLNLDPSKPSEAYAIIEAFNDAGNERKIDWSYQRAKPEALRQLDAAWQTLTRDVPTGLPDMTLRAFPGHEGEVQALVKKAQTIAKGKWSPPEFNEARKAKVPARRPVAPVAKDDAARIKFMQKVPAGGNPRYALDSLLIDKQGGVAVVTDGKAMWILRKTGRDSFGKDGQYGPKSIDKNGKLLAPNEEQGTYPPYEQVIPKGGQPLADIDALDTISAVRRAAVVLPYHRGVVVVLNPDKTLGFASFDPQEGSAEVRVGPNSVVLGGVDPEYLADAIQFIRMTTDNDRLSMTWDAHNRPILLEARGGNGHHAQAVVMPINLPEGFAAGQKYVAPGSPEPRQAALTGTETKEEASGPSEMASPAKSLPEPPKGSTGRTFSMSEGGGPADGGEGEAKSPAERPEASGPETGTAVAEAPKGRNSAIGEALFGKDSFVGQDVVPTLNAAARGVVEAKEDIQALLAPQTAGDQARTAANMLREHGATLAQRTDRAVAALKEARKYFQSQSREDNLAFMDAVEQGTPQADPQLQQFSGLMRKMLDGRLKEVQKLGRLKQFIEDYFPHIWKDPGKASSIIGRILGKRPLEGTKSFLKKRTIPTIKEGIEQGLEPVSDNPVDLVLLKLREMDKWILARRTLNEMKTKDLVKYVPVHQHAPDGYGKIDDPIARIYGPPTITIQEAFDKVLREKALDLADTLGITHERLVSLGKGQGKGPIGGGGGGRTWGQSIEGAGKIRTRFGGPDFVILHEIGHQLDERYGLGKELTQDASPDMQQRLNGELNELADLRYEGQDSPTAKFMEYVRTPEEKMATVVQAYTYAREVMKQVAPTVLKKFETFIDAHPELAELKTMRPSLSMGTGEAEKPHGGMLIMGNYYAPQPVANVMNNYLSPGLRGKSGVFRAYLGAGNFLNQAQLGLSLFHAGFTALDAATSKLALAIEHGVGRRFKESIKAAALTPLAPFENIMRGDKVLKEWFSPGSQGGDLAKIVDAMKAGGGRAKMDDFYRTKLTERMVDAFKRGNITGGMMRLPGAILETAAKPIMEYIVPRQKMGIFADMARMELEKLGPDAANRDLVRAAMAKAWDSVDNRMGQVVYDNLFWNKTVKDLSMASVRSVGWNLGTLRELGGGVMDFGKVPLDAVRGRKPEFTHRMAYLLAMPLLAGLIGGVMNYWMTGEPPKELKDYFFPRTGEIDRNGHAVRMSLPSYMKDVYGYTTHPLQVVANKLHPAISAVAQMLANKDYYGVKIRNEDDPLVKQLLDMAKYAAAQVEPFGFRNYRKLNEESAPLGKRLLPFIGVTQASPRYSLTDAERTAMDLAAEKLPRGSRTQEDFERSNLKADLAGQLKAGKPDAAVNLQKAVNEGKLTPTQAHEVVKRSTQTTLEHAIEHLDAEDAMRVWDQATDAEKQSIRPQVLGKIDRSKSLSPERQRELFQRVQQ